MPAQSYAGSDDLASRPVVHAGHEVAPLAGSDDLATRIVVVPAQIYAGIDDHATRLTGRSCAESDDRATRQTM